MVDIEVDFLIIADAAQVSEGKLFLLGGCWDRLTAHSFPVAHPMGVAFGILLPRSAVGTAHRFRIEVSNDDDESTLARIEGDFDKGPTGGEPQLETERMLFAVNFPLRFQGPASCSARLFVDGVMKKMSRFQVVGPGPS